MCQEAARQFAGKGGIIINMSALTNATRRPERRMRKRSPPSGAPSIC
jgi:hypothetical protein